MAAASAELTLANADERAYQSAIARSCYARNSLIVLPTGLGKTIVCALVMTRHLEDGERVLVIAPTRPLVEQHAATFREQLAQTRVEVITGATSPDDRGEVWAAAQVAVATPQVARNDLVAGRMDPASWGLLVVDEAHRAVGNYAAVPVAEALRADGARVLAATASPGSDVETIQEVCKNLGIQHIEARGEWDEDVEPYVNPVSIEWVRVSLPNKLQRAAEELRRLTDRRVSRLRSMGLYPSRFTNRSQLLQLRDRLRKRDVAATRKRTGQALELVASALRVLHGVKLVETQSTAAARAYLAEIAGSDPTLEEELRDARRLLDGYLGEHPKMRRCANEIQRQLTGEPGSRALVFVQTRQTAHALQAALDERTGLQAGCFVGQGGPDGLSQQAQLDLVQRFRDGELNVLVATSVGEEGLDIPSVDLVVFYEAVASAVRTIQRRGRTGRKRRGRVVVLMARGTSDEAAYWAATKRERQMRSLIRELQADPPAIEQPAIRPNPSARPAPEPGGPRILVDHTELNGSLARLLTQAGLRLDPTNLPVGDLILSNRLAIERKTAQDLVRSIIDGRLMKQAKALKRSYDAPILLVEGDPLDQPGRMRPEAIAGAIAALTASFGVTVLTVRDAQQAAILVAAMAKREREDAGPPAVRNDAPGEELEERQRFLMEGLPSVSATLGRRLLEHFGTPAAALEASEAELREVDGIGPTKARAIREVLHAPFDVPWPNGTSRSTRAQESTTPSGTGARKSAS